MFSRLHRDRRQLAHQGALLSSEDNSLPPSLPPTDLWMRLDVHNHDRQGCCIHRHFNRTRGIRLDARWINHRRPRMQPIGNAWNKLPRLVRDLSREMGKKIELTMLGADTELDRQVLELIKDPLTHMVRNSGDHGLETPGRAPRRRQAGDRPHHAERLPRRRPHHHRDRRRRPRPAAGPDPRQGAGERPGDRGGTRRHERRRSSSASSSAPVSPPPPWSPPYPAAASAWTW